MNKHLNNRAVSQVIAALLLIAIAVSAAILLYVFSIGLLGSLGSGGGQQTKEQLILEAYNWPVSGDLTGAFRNVGTATIDVGGAHAFINGVQAAISVSTATLGPHDSTGFMITVPAGTYNPGGAYPLKIVTPTGGVFSYTVIFGSSS